MCVSLDGVAPTVRTFPGRRPVHDECRPRWRHRRKSISISYFSPAWAVGQADYGDLRISACETAHSSPRSSHQDRTLLVDRLVWPGPICEERSASCGQAVHERARLQWVYATGTLYASGFCAARDKIFMVLCTPVDNVVYKWPCVAQCHALYTVAPVGTMAFAPIEIGCRRDAKGCRTCAPQARSQAQRGLARKP